MKPWVRTNGPREHNRSWRAMWEPVLIFYGRKYRHPRNLIEADWVCAVRNERSAGRHPTQKPDELLGWLFERLLAGAEGRLALDLFAGTGGAALMASHVYGLDAVAVEREPRFCQLMLERAAAYLPDPRQQHQVAVSANGGPLWPTLGRAA